MTTKQLKQLKKDNPKLNNTELALLVGKYATPEYYKAIHLFNEIRGQ